MRSDFHQIADCNGMQKTTPLAPASNRGQAVSDSPEMTALHPFRRRFPLKPLIVPAIACALALASPASHAQAPAPAASPTAQQPDDSAGPTVDNGPIVIPRKKESAEPPPPPAPEHPTVKNPNGATYSLSVNVPLVNLDVSVILDRNHQFVPGLIRCQLPGARRRRRAEGRFAPHRADAYHGRHAARVRL